MSNDAWEKEACDLLSQLFGIYEDRPDEVRHNAKLLMAALSEAFEAGKNEASANAGHCCGYPKGCPR